MVQGIYAHIWDHGRCFINGGNGMNYAMLRVVLAISSVLQVFGCLFCRHQGSLLVTLLYYENTWCTLWQFNIAIENGPVEILDLPIKDGDFPWFFVWYVSLPEGMITIFCSGWFAGSVSDQITIFCPISPKSIKLGVSEKMRSTPNLGIRTMMIRWLTIIFWVGFLFSDINNLINHHHQHHHHHHHHHNR